MHLTFPHFTLFWTCLCFYLHAGTSMVMYLGQCDTSFFVAFLPRYLHVSVTMEQPHHVLRFKSLVVYLYGKFSTHSFTGPFGCFQLFAILTTLQAGSLPPGLVHPGRVHMFHTWSCQSPRTDVCHFCSRR